MRKTALISVYEKAGIVEFGRALAELGWDILASGGTARKLGGAGVPVRDVAELVGEPILGHRVVTLSREIHASLLARGGNAEDEGELERLGIPLIDLVCVDLYPLAETIRSGADYAAVVEQTDIGGPTMLRSAAKGGRIVIAAPEDRASVVELLQRGGVSPQARRRLAAKAEWVVAHYAFISACYLADGECSIRRSFPFFEEL